MTVDEIPEQEWERWNVSPHLREKMKQVAREFRKKPTPGEQKLWQALRRNRLGGLHFKRQEPIGPFIVDFYCAARRLIVEVDGPIHADQEEADRRRQKLLEALGLHFLRLGEEAVMSDLTSALNVIYQATRNLPSR